jgi:putative addiction module component (TIGR02574 family)
MTERAERLTSELMALSLAERAEIVDLLVDSLGDEAEGPDHLEAIDEEFGAEIERRAEAMRNGTADMEPSEKVMSELLKKYS